MSYATGHFEDAATILCNALDVVEGRREEIIKEAIRKSTPPPSLQHTPPLPLPLPLQLPIDVSLSNKECKSSVGGEEGEATEEGKDQGSETTEAEVEVQVEVEVDSPTTPTQQIKSSGKSPGKSSRKSSERSPTTNKKINRSNSKSKKKDQEGDSDVDRKSEAEIEAALMGGETETSSIATGAGSGSGSGRGSGRVGIEGVKEGDLDCGNEEEKNGDQDDSTLRSVLSNASSAQQSERERQGDGHLVPEGEGEGDDGSTHDGVISPSRGVNKKKKSKSKSKNGSKAGSKRGSKVLGESVVVIEDKTYVHLDGIMHGDTDVHTDVDTDVDTDIEEGEGEEVESESPVVIAPVKEIYPPRKQWPYKTIIVPPPVHIPENSVYGLLFSALVSISTSTYACYQ